MKDSKAHPDSEAVFKNIGLLELIHDGILCKRVEYSLDESWERFTKHRNRWYCHVHALGGTDIKRLIQNQASKDQNFHCCFAGVSPEHFGWPTSSVKY